MLTPDCSLTWVSRVYWSTNHQMILILKATASFGELLQITSKIKSRSSPQLFPPQITDTAGLLASTQTWTIILPIYSMSKFKVPTRQTPMTEWSVWLTTSTPWASSQGATKFSFLLDVITPSQMLLSTSDKWTSWSSISTPTIGTISISNTPLLPTSLIPSMPWESTEPE